MLRIHNSDMFTPASSLRISLFVFALVLLLTGEARTQSTCDSDTSCIGNALLFPGGVLDYVDVFNTPGTFQR